MRAWHHLGTSFCMWGAGPHQHHLQFGQLDGAHHGGGAQGGPHLRAWHYLGPTSFHSVQAIINIISNPVNSTVPITGGGAEGDRRLRALHYLGPTSFHSVQAIINIISNPVNSTVPITGGGAEGNRRLRAWHYLGLTLFYLVQAIINIISNPVNSTVPITAEVLMAAGASEHGIIWGRLYFWGRRPSSTSSPTR